MPRTYQRKTAPPSYTFEDILNAVEDVKNKNKTYRQAEEAYGVPKAVIFNRIGGRKNDLAVVSRGRKPALSSNVEDTIARCLISRSRAGYPCDKEDLLNLVGTYVKTKNLATPFINGKPGYDWYRSFMSRHPLKKPEHLQKARQDARKADIIFDFYKKLDKIYVDFDLLSPDKAAFILNADESGFGSDPSRLRAIGEKGVPLSRVSGGSGRESTTVLACVSASGDKLPPLIVFKGGAVQARWTSTDCFPGTLFAASKEGWMEEPQFYHWILNGLIPHVKKVRIEKCNLDQTAILLYDGHSSHISVRIVEEAVKNNIQLIRFPSHLTDKLQPLDKCVFGPVKTAWDKALVSYGKKMMGQGSCRLPKNEFSALLKPIWENNLTSLNITSGFKSTGIFPFDPTKFNAFSVKEQAIYNDLCKVWSTSSPEHATTSISMPQQEQTPTFPLDFIHAMRLTLSEHATTSIAVPQQEPTSPVSPPGTAQIEMPSTSKGTSQTFENTINESTVQTEVTLPLQSMMSPPEELLENIFNLHNSSPSSKTKPEIAKKVVSRLKQMKYGEVLTTNEVLTRLKEADELKAEKLSKKRPKKEKPVVQENIKSSRSKKIKTRKTNVSSSSDEDNVSIPSIESVWNEGIEEAEEVEFLDIEGINNLRPGQFVVVNFKGGKRLATTYKYVCEIRKVLQEEEEVEVVGTISIGSSKTIFQVVESDKSFVSLNQVLGLLPDPIKTTVEGKITVEFNAKVPVFEL